MDVVTDYGEYLGACTVRSLNMVLEQMTAAGQAVPPADARAFAMHTLDYGFRLPGVWRQVRRFLLALGPKMEQAGHRGEWLTLLELALEQSQRHGDQEIEGELHYQRAILLRLVGRLDEADAAFRASAQLFESLGDEVRLARTLGRHAFLAWVNRNLAQAEERVARAEALLCGHETAIEERAYCRLVRGALALARNEWEHSVGCYQEAQHLWEQTKNLRMQALCLMNQGTPLVRMARYAEAASAYGHSRAIFESIQDTSNWALATMNVGFVLNAQGRSLEALRMYSEAEALFRKTGDHYRLAEIHNNQGEALRSLGRWEQAEDAYRLSIELWRKLQTTEDLINCLDNLGFVLIAQQKPDVALSVLHEALDLLATITDHPQHDSLHRTVTEKVALAKSALLH